MPGVITDCNAHAESDSRKRNAYTMPDRFEKRASADFNDQVDLWSTFETVIRRVRVALDGLPGTIDAGDVLMTPPNHEMTARAESLSDARAVLDANDLSPSYAFFHLIANDAESRQYLTVSFFLWLDLKRIGIDVSGDSKVYTAGVAEVAVSYLDKVLADNVIAVPDEPQVERSKILVLGRRVRRGAAKLLNNGIRWSWVVFTGVAIAVIGAFFILKFGLYP
jgi:hypothetical protein